MVSSSESAQHLRVTLCPAAQKQALSLPPQTAQSSPVSMLPEMPARSQLPGLHLGLDCVCRSPHLSVIFALVSLIPPISSSSSQSACFMHLQHSPSSSVLRAAKCPVFSQLESEQLPVVFWSTVNLPSTTSGILFLSLPALPRPSSNLESSWDTCLITAVPAPSYYRALILRPAKL